MRGIDSTYKVSRLRIVAIALMVSLVVPFAHASAAWQEITGSIKRDMGALQPPLGPHNVDIEYRGNGVIRLNGSVSSQAERERIASIAEQTKGVKEVENQLTVSAAGYVSGESQDEVQRIKQELRQQVRSGAYSVSIESVHDGVILRGDATTLQTKEEILKVARAVSKRNIIDQIVVKNPVDDASIKKSIEQLVRKEYPSLLKTLDVEVSKGIVTLHGNLPSRREVDKVLASILMVDGVADIQSDLTVGGRPYMRER
jgi:osmotically-inducible protein OsmY